MGVSINRLNALNDQSPWDNAYFGFNSNNIFANFNSDFFSKDLNLSLINITIDTPSLPTDKSYLFHYKLKDSSVNVEFTFYVLASNFNPNEKFPRNFKGLAIIKK